MQAPAKKTLGVGCAILPISYLAVCEELRRYMSCGQFLYLQITREAVGTRLVKYDTDLPY